MKYQFLSLFLFSIAITANNLAAAGKVDNELLAENVEQRFYLTFMEKLLLIEPESVDKFALLEQDIKRFDSELKAATDIYTSTISDYKAYRKDDTNDKNLNDQFKLFNQLDNQQYLKLIKQTEYEVNKMRAKLYYSLFEYESIKKRVEDIYRLQHQAPISLLKEKLLRGESFVLVKGQKKQILEFLLEHKDQPQVLAQMLNHQNVQEILPEYLIEQLNIFKQANVDLETALQNQAVMSAVVAKISEVDVLPQMGLIDLGAKLYSEQYAPKVLSLGAKPILLDSYLDADLHYKLNIATIYELPVPSEDLVNF